MNSEWVLAIGSAVWLGLLTAISPCPMATNIAAVSYIARRLDKPGAAMATGLLYAIGRSAAYILLAAAIVSSVLAAPAVSHWLQKYMNKLLGPLLIIVGMILLGLIRVPLGTGNLGERVSRRVANWGVWSGLGLGAIFAMSFCPSSAALYFGSLIPLAIKSESTFVVPGVYGVSTALPVVGFAIVITLCASAAGTYFNRIALLEVWARRVTGVLFIAVGLYFSVRYVFAMF